MSRLIYTSLLALCLFAATYAVNLQAPLYSVYTGSGPAHTTAISLAFAAYVCGLMPGLIFLGGLSDRIGRRAPILIALVLATTATVLVMQWTTWGGLATARFLLGASTALATTAGTAYMAELFPAERAKTAALLVTSATSLGFGSGALATGVSLGLQGPTLVPASYTALIAALPLLLLATLKLPKVYKTRPVSLLRLPIFPKGTRVYGIAMALAWSATGMTIAVVPLELAARGLGAWTGLVVFLAIFTGFLCQPLAKHITNRSALTLGFCLVPLGFAVLLYGILFNSLAAILIGTCLTSAASYGFTYLSALAEVSIRAPSEKARATAGLLTYAYFGFSIPTIMSGALADLFDTVTAMLIFGSTLSILTLIVLIFWARQTRASSAAGHIRGGAL